MGGMLVAPPFVCVILTCNSPGLSPRLAALNENEEDCPKLKWGIASAAASHNQLLLTRLCRRIGHQCRAHCPQRVRIADGHLSRLNCETRPLRVLYDSADENRALAV